ncbi:DedA family protein [Cognatishimia maritima]|uniref:Membrane protein DedA, SNARE-associated domain n=1 Tax=Cognatishimia maritima TaxID=870908 RepID=A0A1M5IZ42_9RHOB|nr:DedA family protein [Cognatishimia maritima]SHG33607.1 membrane protein DedA, SNARE-associated domain [Cognatishimia maritima]
MIEALTIYLADYGALTLFFVTFASCLAMPVPSSLLMLTSGAFVATGDLSLGNVVIAALSGAVLGDICGFLLGHRLQTHVNDFAERSQKRQALLRRAGDILDQRGMIGVYLSRWLFSPLGPYVNFVAGATGMHPLRFVIAGALGEATWVCLYIGLGFLFAGNLSMAAELASDTIGLLAAVFVMLGTGAWILHNRRKLHATQRG